MNAKSRIKISKYENKILSYFTPRKKICIILSCIIAVYLVLNSISACVEISRVFLRTRSLKNAYCRFDKYKKIGCGVDCLNEVKYVDTLINFYDKNLVVNQSMTIYYPFPPGMIRDLNLDIGCYSPKLTEWINDINGIKDCWVDMKTRTGILSPSKTDGCGHRDLMCYLLVMPLSCIVAFILVLLLAALCSSIW
jgi:hypothetical protein